MSNRVNTSASKPAVRQSPPAKPPEPKKAESPTPQAQQAASSSSGTSRGQGKAESPAPKAQQATTTSSSPEASRGQGTNAPGAQGKDKSLLDKSVEGYSNFLKSSYEDAQALAQSNNKVEQFVGKASLAVRDSVTNLNNTIRTAEQFYANSDNAVVKHVGGTLTALGKGVAAPALLTDHTQSANEIKSNALETAITVGTLGGGKVLSAVAKSPVGKFVAQQADELGSAVMKSPVGRAATETVGKLSTAVAESPVGREIAEKAPKLLDATREALGKVNRAPAELLRKVPGGQALLETETAVRQTLGRINNFGHVPAPKPGAGAALLGDPAFRKLDQGVQQQVLSRMDEAQDLFAQQNLGQLVRSEGFASHSAANQQQFLNMLDRAPTDPKLLRDTQSLAANSTFQKLPQSVQSTALEKIVPHAADRTARRTLTELASSPGFRQLPEDTQQKLLRYAGGTNPQVSEPGRKALGSLVESPPFWNSTPAEQASQLQKFLDDQPGAPAVAAVSHGQVPRKPFSVSAPTDMSSIPFRSGTADAQQYIVNIGNDRIPVYMSKDVDAAAGSLHDIDEVANGLAALPDSSRSLVKEVYVDGKMNPDDAFWSKQYNDPNFRSYMTAGATGQISIYPTTAKQAQSALDGSLIHETGHTLSKRLWGNSPDPRWNTWQDAARKDGVVASQYAKANVEEDFSESLVVYNQVKGTPREAELRELMPERFKILDHLLGP